MKYIKKFNEEVFFEWETNPICVKLQEDISKLNKKLLNDEVWKNFYHRIELYDYKASDPEFLKSVLKFAENRIKELKEELKQDTQNVISLFEDFEEDDIVQKYIKSMNVTLSNINYDPNVDMGSQEYNGVTVTINLRESIFNKRTKSLPFKGLYFQNEEIIEFWPKIIQLTKNLDTLDCKIYCFYKPESNSMIFRVILK